MTCHAVERTSPYGAPFIGKCLLCGKDGLGLMGALFTCENPQGLSDDEILVSVIGPPEKDDDGKR